VIHECYEKSIVVMKEQKCDDYHITVGDISTKVTLSLQSTTIIVSKILYIRMMIHECNEKSINIMTWMTKGEGVHDSNTTSSEYYLIDKVIRMYHILCTMFIINYSSITVSMSITFVFVSKGYKVGHEER
jgi:hypothetical protein